MLVRKRLVTSETILIPIRLGNRHGGTFAIMVIETLTDTLELVREHFRIQFFFLVFVRIG
jgi:hypothetical protein